MHIVFEQFPSFKLYIATVVVHSIFFLYFNLHTLLERPVTIRSFRDSDSEPVLTVPITCSLP